MAAGYRDLLAMTLGWHSSPAVVVPTVPGIEYTLPVNRAHYELPENRGHYTLPENRAHFVIPLEN